VGKGLLPKTVGITAKLSLVLPPDAADRERMLHRSRPSCQRRRRNSSLPVGTIGFVRDGSVPRASSFLAVKPGIEGVRG